MTPSPTTEMTCNKSSVSDLVAITTSVTGTAYLVNGDDHDVDQVNVGFLNGSFEQIRQHPVESLLDHLRVAALELAVRD